MNKSILVIDTPNRCLDCPLGNSEESDGEEVYCSILECTTYQSEIYEDEEEEELYNSKKPDYCPLKEVPRKKIAIGIDGTSSVTEIRERGRQEGYNACIEEILKGSDSDE